MRNITYELLNQAPNIEWGINLLNTTAVYLAESVKDIEDNWKNLRPCMIQRLNPLRADVYNRFVEIDLIDARIEAIRYSKGERKGEIVNFEEEGINTIGFYLKDDSGKLPVCLPSFPESPALAKIRSGEFKHDDRADYVRLLDFYYQGNIYLYDLSCFREDVPRTRKKKKFSEKLEELLDYFPGPAEPIQVPIRG